MDLESPWGRYAPGPWPRFWIRVGRAVPEGRLWSRLALLIRRLARLGLTGPVDTTVWGQRLRLAARGGVSEGRILFLPQLWDSWERRLLGDLLPAGSVFVDVGANAGGYTFWAASVVGPGGRVLAIEPDPALAARLAFNAESNRSVAPIDVVAVALADREGEGELILDSANTGENRLAPDTGTEVPEERVVVPVRTLQRVLEDAGVDRVQVLKVDVEGGEQAILEPFLRTAPPGSWPRVILAELKRAGGADDALVDLLEDRGYRLAQRGRLNGLFHLVSPRPGHGAAG